MFSNARQWPAAKPTEVRVVNAYFGRLPSYFPLWLHTAKKNSRFQWILISDQDFDQYDLGPNIQAIQVSFDEFRTHLSTSLKVSATGITPYKICDFKPTYGVALAPLLEGAKFWGYTDIDLLNGDLDKFITPADLEKYDKFFIPAHLQLFRNSEQMNTLFRRPGLKLTWDEAIKVEGSTQYSEHAGVHRLALAAGVPYRYESRIVDLDPEVKRCRGHNIRNASKQLFFYQNGKALQRTGRGPDKEFMYIHFQKRKLAIPPELLRDPSLLEKGVVVGRDRFAMLDEFDSFESAVQALNPPDPKEELKLHATMLQRRLRNAPIKAASILRARISQRSQA